MWNSGNIFFLNTQIIFICFWQSVHIYSVFETMEIKEILRNLPVT